jgi:serralysin
LLALGGIDHISDFKGVFAMPLPTYTNDQIAAQLTTGFAVFNGETPHHWNVSAGGTISVNIGGLNVAGQFFANAALQMWSEVTGIHFSFVTSAAQLTFFDDGTNSAYETDTWTGSATLAAQVHISQNWIKGSYVDSQNVTHFYDDSGNLNTYSYQTYLHEIGHALGLGHAGNYNGNGTSYDQNLGTAGHNQYLNDSWQATVMSYFSQVPNSNNTGNTWINAGFAYIMTPMVADIIAVNNLYNAGNATTTDHLGNTIYGFNSTLVGSVFDATAFTGVSYTILDSGGIDTMDYSGYSQAQKINLNAETYSDVGGVVGSITIARGTLVENAVGGSGADIITGNGADNKLKGGAGVDTLDGGAGIDTADFSDKSAIVSVTLNGATAATVTVGGTAEDTLKNIENIIGGSNNDVLNGDGLVNRLDGGLGNDTLNGGGGIDTLVGGGGNDTYIVDDTGDVTTELSGGGIDTVQSSVTFTLATEIENLTLTGAMNINGVGNGLANTIIGNNGNNILVGGAGADNLAGGGGNDTASYTSSSTGVTVDLRLPTAQVSTGDASGDILTGISNLTGSAQADTLVGNANANILHGGLGDDTLNGGAGADQLFGDGGNDFASYVNSALGVTVDLRLTTAQVSAGDASDDILFGISNLIGSTLADTLLGDANSNSLNGGAGGDYLNGNGGNDFIYGGIGDDTIVFNTGLLATNVDGGTGIDKLLVIDGILPTSFNLVTAGIENAQWQQTDMGSNNWSTIVSNYNSSWAITDSFTNYDSGQKRSVVYDLSGQYWSTLVQDFNSSNQRFAFQYNYDDGRIAHTTEDLTGAATYWTTLEQRFNAAGQRTDYQYNYDDGRIAHTDIDLTGTTTYWSTLEQKYNAAGQRTEYQYNHDNGRITHTTVDLTGTATYWSSLEQRFDALSRRDGYTYHLDNGSVSDTSIDANHDFTWDTLQQNFNAAGARTDYTYFNDDNSKQMVTFDVDNLYSWNTQTINYDTMGHIINILYM